MAEVKRSTPAILKENIAEPGAKLTPLKIKLRTKTQETEFDFSDFHTLIVGEPGTGKTTLGGQEEGVLSLSFDPINKSYNRFLIQEFIPDWRTLLGYRQLLEKKAIECAASGKQFPYRRIQIDGAGTMAVKCQEAVCKRRGIDHPGDEGFARAYDAIFGEFAECINRFMTLPCGSWFIAHLKDKTLQTRDGRDITRMSPDIKGQMENILVGRCHLVVNIEYLPGSKSRLATIRGDECTVAKCDIDGRFLTPDGRQVEEIVLGNQGPGVAWERFMRAFNNGQRWANLKEMKAMTAKQKGKVTTTKEA